VSSSEQPQPALAGPGIGGSAWRPAVLLTHPLAAPDRTGAGGRKPPRQNFCSLNLLLVVTLR